jgi:hypothetical protein
MVSRAKSSASSQSVADPNVRSDASHRCCVNPKMRHPWHSTHVSGIWVPREWC